MQNTPTLRGAPYVVHNGQEPNGRDHYIVHNGQELEGLHHYVVHNGQELDGLDHYVVHNGQKLEGLDHYLGRNGHELEGLDHYIVHCCDAASGTPPDSRGRDGRREDHNMHAIPTMLHCSFPRILPTIAWTNPP